MIRHPGAGGDAEGASVVGGGSMALKKGDLLETVLLGGLCEDVLSLWRGDGRRECHRVIEGEYLSRALAHGILARTSPEPNRFREIGLLDASGSTLFLPGRAMAREGDDSATVGGGGVGLEDCDEVEPVNDDWLAWARWLSGVVAAASARGEFVVIETGGWDAIPEPYVLVCVMRSPAGEWRSSIEAVPAPDTAPWQQHADSPGSSVSAPATSESVGVSGILAVEAMRMWARSPLDVVLTFGSHSHGAWSPRGTDDNVSQR